MSRKNHNPISWVPTVYFAKMCIRDRLKSIYLVSMALLAGVFAACNDNDVENFDNQVYINGSAMTSTCLLYTSGIPCKIFPGILVIQRQLNTGVACQRLVGYVYPDWCRT